MKRNNTLSRAERRRRQRTVNAKPTILELIKATLLRLTKINTLMLMFAILGVLTPVIIYFCQTNKDKKEVKVCLDNYEICGQETISIYYLVPSCDKNQKNTFMYLPLQFINTYVNVIENFGCELSVLNKDVKEMNDQGFIIKAPRFSETSNYPEHIKRTRGYSSRGKKEILRFDNLEINPHMMFELDEKITFWPNYFSANFVELKEDEFINGDILDQVDISLNLSHKDMKTEFSTKSLNIYVSGFTVEKMIDYLDENGHFPFNPCEINLREKTISKNNTAYIIVPKDSLSIPTHDVDVYRFKQLDQKFLSKRKLIINYNDTEETIILSKLSESKYEKIKKQQELMLRNFPNYKIK